MDVDEFDLMTEKGIDGFEVFRLSELPKFLNSKME